ncbi:MAG: hypothetical protein SF097_15160 [Acidobacteriota bacterium]|nr:hypothetical protein [Acidobacteriota bacterium]
MKNTFFKTVLIAAMVVGLAISALAQTQSPETPEAVAKAYFAAMQASDWDKCADLLHPEALGSMKRTFAKIINADVSGGAAKTIFGLKTNEEFASLSGATIFERLLNFMSGASPEMKTVLAASKTTVLGKVTEGIDLVHVVYRTQIKMSGAEISEVELMSFKKHGTTWRGLLTADMEEMVTNLAEGLSGKKE